MYESYFVVDVETCPIDLDGYFLLETDEEKIKKLNPIDSKIIAIGIRNRGESKIFSGDEKDILTKFWSEWKKLKYGSPSILLVGFNVTNFDIPFIVARSFINNIEIVPFSLKSVLDVKEKINAMQFPGGSIAKTDYSPEIRKSIEEMKASGISEEKAIELLSD